MNDQNINKINDIYIDILKHGIDIYKNNNGNIDDEYLFNLKKNIIYLTEANKKLVDIIKVSEELIIGCNNRIEEVKKDLYLEKKYEGHPDKVILMFKEKNKGLKWGDISYLEDKKEEVINNTELHINNKKYYTTYNNIMYKNLNNIYNVKLDFDFKLPIITEIKDIPPSLYWYNGDKIYSEGIYMSLGEDVFIKVPFPDTIDYLNSTNKKYTIKCKNSTIEECKKFRNSINKNNNNYIHNCNYLHKGEKFLKINNIVRTSNSHFGKHSCINRDLKNTKYSDIQSIILYSVSDLLLNSLWVQKQKKIGNLSNKIITNIDVSL